MVLRPQPQIYSDWYPHVSVKGNLHIPTSHLWSLQQKSDTERKQGGQRADHFVQEALSFNLEHVAVLISHDIKASDDLDRVLISFTNIGKVREVMLPNKQLGSLPDSSSASVRRTLHDLMCVASF